MSIFGKLTMLLTIVALGLLTHPQLGAAQRVCPIVDLTAGCLIGGKVGDQWLNDEKMVRLLKGEEKYRLYSMTKFIGSATGGKPKESQGTALRQFGVQMTPAPNLQEYMVAIGGQWNALPRVPKLTSLDQEVLKETVANILKMKGISNPKVKLTQVIRVDLDGDGVEEEIVSASTYKEQEVVYSKIRFLQRDQEEGSYSLILLRKVIQGKVKNLVIAEDYYRGSMPMRDKVAAILDVDGDGVMEIILHGVDREGWATSVFRVESTGVKQVLSRYWY
jgi:hypothetical protein